MNLDDKIKNSYYKQKKEKILKYQKQYYNEHITDIKEYNHQYYLNNYTDIRKRVHNNYIAHKQPKELVRKDTKKRFISKEQRVKYNTNSKIKRINKMTCQYNDDGLIKLDLF